MKIQTFLEHHGIARNPFSDEDAQTEPVFVIGDLNCSPWSVRFRDLLRDGRLRDSSVGMGWQPTWPANLWWFGIPIDHCLYGAGLHVHRREVAAHVGSDHRPLLVEVGVVGER